MMMFLRVAAVLMVFTLALIFLNRVRAGIQAFLAKLILVCGLTLPFFVGTTTELILPGLPGIAAGGLAGSLIGWTAFALYGVCGVVSGGAGFAVGSLAMIVMAGSVGAFGGVAAGFGLKTTTYMLVSPLIWGPMIVLALITIGRIKKQNIVRTKPAE